MISLLESEVVTGKMCASNKNVNIFIVLGKIFCEILVVLILIGNTRKARQNSTMTTTAHVFKLSNQLALWRYFNGWNLSKRWGKIRHRKMCIIVHIYYIQLIKEKVLRNHNMMQSRREKVQKHFQTTHPFFLCYSRCDRYQVFMGTNFTSRNHNIFIFKTLKYMGIICNL